MRRAVLVAITLLPLTAHAGINKCNISGKTVYQEAPCPAGTGRATFAARNDVSDESAKASRAKFEAGKSAQDNANRAKAIDEQIDTLKWNIEQYQETMERELASLQTKKLSARNNLAGATWEQSISTEMEAVTAKYRTKIQVAQDEIASLRKEKAALPRATP